MVVICLFIPLSANTIANTIKEMKNMSKWSAILAIPLLAASLMGCGDKDKASNVHKNAPVSNSGENEPVTTAPPNSNDTTNKKVNGAPFSFSEFDLEVDYGANQFYNIEYENERDGAEVKVENNRKNQLLEGNAAYEHVQKLFKKLTFDSKTPDQEVLNEVISVFHLGSDYKKIELEIKFEDNVERHYTFTK